jgi:hypothetical protein
MSSGNRYYSPKPAALRLLPTVTHDEEPEDDFDPEEGRRVVYRMFDIEQRLEEIEKARESGRYKRTGFIKGLYFVFLFVFWAELAVAGQARAAISLSV